MKHLYYLSFLLLCVACGPKAPTNEQLKDLCRNAAFAMAEQKDEAGKDKAFQEVVAGIVKEFDINKITSEQIHFLFQDGGFPLNRNLRLWMAPVLEEKAKQEGEEGVAAIFYRWKYLPSTNDYNEGKRLDYAAFKAVLLHPMMQGFLLENEEAMTDVMNGMSRIEGDNWLEAGVLENIKSILDLTLPDEAVQASMGVFNAIFIAENVPAVEKDGIRQRVLKQYIALLNDERYSKGKKRERVQEAINYLQGAYAMGTLEGNKAPKLDLIWISNGNEKGLDDFTGKVVVLDFWGTKCAPCLGIFPNMRKLQRRYAGYPVVIIGVTSIMGYHVDPKNKRTIPTAGKPDLEIELMQGFMKDMGINWRVAFSKQNVMNWDYGVISIPHLVMIDAKGNVRHNNVDPFTAPFHKAEMIDALLKEAGLRCPPQPMDSVNYSGN